MDHTSILKTVEQRWSLPSLTARDAAAPGFGGVLTLAAPRTDDVLAGVTVPAAEDFGPAAGRPSHLEEIRDELISRQLPAGAHPLAPAGALP
jgi:phospholipase C